MMYQDISTIKGYPKTLVIRNEIKGMIWQIYHVDNEQQAYYIAKGAKDNGFEGRTLEDYMANEEETFPNWRMEMATFFIKLLPDYLILKQ